MSSNNAVKLGNVLHNCTHHTSALNAVPIVRERRSTLVNHVANLSKLLSLRTLSQSTHGTHMDETNLIATVNLKTNSSSIIGDRIGIWHSGNVSETTMNRSSRACFDGLLVLKTRISKVDVHVNKARRQHLTLCINNNITHLRFNRCCNLINGFSVNTNIHYRIKIKLWVNNACTLKQKCHQSLLPEANTFRPCALKRLH